MSTLTVSGKALGSNKPLFADWSTLIPPEWQDGGPVTLRDVIGRVVRAEVQAFCDRQHQRQVLRALTSRNIADGVERGKVTMGESEVGIHEVEIDQALATACQAFEDGVFLVSLDGNEIRQIDAEVQLQPNSRITFVRLVMLAGG